MFCYGIQPSNLLEGTTVDCDLALFGTLLLDTEDIIEQIPKAVSATPVEASIVTALTDYTFKVILELLDGVLILLDKDHPLAFVNLYSTHTHVKDRSL
jgi:hypothetical protein